MSVALLEMDKPTEAREVARKAVALAQTLVDKNPGERKYQEQLAGSHGAMGNVLMKTGKPEESLDSWRSSIAIRRQLGNPNPDWELKGLATATRLATAQNRLPVFLKGEFQPADEKERLDLAEWCQIKKLNHTAAGLYTAMFAADPKLADDLKASHMYHAACAAALAAAGQGDDAAKLDDTERARLRKQAREWLRAELTLRTKQLESGKPADRDEAQRAVRNWQKVTEFAAIRDATALAKLPAEEQKALTQLWADVAAFLKKANGPPSRSSASP